MKTIKSNEKSCLRPTSAEHFKTKLFANSKANMFSFSYSLDRLTFTAMFITAINETNEYMKFIKVSFNSQILIIVIGLQFI